MSNRKHSLDVPLQGSKGRTIEPILEACITSDDLSRELLAAQEMPKMYVCPGVSGTCHACCAAHAKSILTDQLWADEQS